MIKTGLDGTPRGKDFPPPNLCHMPSLPILNNNGLYFNHNKSEQEGHMTHFLSSDKRPDGHKLEDILKHIRNDIIYRGTKIMNDQKPEAQHVLNNNIQILNHLEEAIKLAEDSTAVLNRAFGTSNSGKPRIGDS